MLDSHVLRIRDFSVLFTSRVLSTIALQAQAVMVGWHIYELSHDPLLLGLMGLAEAVPAIACAFFAGHFVDHRRPAQVYKWCLLGLVLNCLMIWVSVRADVPLTPTQRLVFLFVSVFISGLVRSFAAPSTFSIISSVVPRPMLPQAAAINSSAFQTANIFGPALGGLVYGAFSPEIAFLLPPVFMFASWLSVNSFSEKTRALHRLTQAEPFLASIRAGIKFAFREKVLLGSMAMDMFSVLFGGAVAVLPIFSDQVLHAGSLGLGILRSAPSVGSAITALFLGFRPMRATSGSTLLWVVVGFGLSTIAFALSKTFLLAFFFLALSGAFDGVSMVIRGTILQLLTPESMRGRISSISLIFITSSNEIGAFESGVAARLLGLIPSIIFGGIMTLVVVAGTAYVAPELRRARLK